MLEATLNKRPHRPVLAKPIEDDGLEKDTQVRAKASVSLISTLLATVGRGKG